MVSFPPIGKRNFVALRRGAGLLLVTAAILFASAFGFFRAADHHLAEWRFQTRTIVPTGDVVLVDIDARSLAEIGVWPWPRHLHGDLLRAAKRVGAARVAFDVDFSAESTPEQDQAFAAALAETGIETFLASFVQFDTAAGTRVRESLPIEPLLRNAWPAGVNVPVDRDGQVRRFPFAIDLRGETLTSMPSLLADRDGATGMFGIDYAISADRLPRVSYVDLLYGRIDPDRLAGKTLIVGASAIELGDFFTVPVSGTVSGSTVIALATETLLQGRALHLLAVPWFMLAGLGFVVGACASRLSTRQAIAAFAGLAVTTELLALYLQNVHAVVLETAGIHALLVGFSAWALSREFDLRRLRLWIARTQAANSQSILERVIDDGFHGVAILDDRLQIARINGEALELLGLPGATCLEDLPAQIARDLATAVADFKRGEGAAKLAVRTLHITAGTERVVEYSIVPFWLSAIADEAGQAADNLAYASLTLRDITERERAHDRIRFMALHDSLTGLGNRRALEQQLEDILHGPVPEGGVALLSFDLDRFKVVNDGLGHAIGDDVLRETAARARERLATALMIARIGGDEFSAVVPAASREAAQAVAACLVETIREPFFLSGHRICVGASVGLSWWDGQDATVTSMMRHADVALYRAKRSFSERVVVFEPPMDGDRLARLKLEEDLEQAFERNEFLLLYQPQVRLSAGTIVGAEALIRWRHPERGFVSPAAFIPIAEEMGLIHRLGAWVLETACRDAMRWPHPIKIAVNVSAIQFQTGDLVRAVRHALQISGLPPERLELEITESAFVEESDGLKPIFDELLATGVSFALDDFGTGYSSLGYLHRFPIAKIKIDRSFVTDILTSQHSIAVLRSIMALADGLSIRTIAEGIETPEQAEMLRLSGCDDGQGYLFAKPIESEKVAQLVNAGRGADGTLRAAG